MFFVKNRMVNAKKPGIIHRKMIPGFVYVFFLSARVMLPCFVH